MKANRILAILIFALIITPLVSATGHNLKGTVKDSEGKPLLGVLISILPVNSNTADKMVSVTDLNGNYKFENLPKGKYKIAATTLDGKFAEQQTVRITNEFVNRKDFIINLQAVKSLNLKPVDTEYVLRSKNRDILRQESTTEAPKIYNNLTPPQKSNLEGINAEFQVAQEQFSGENKSPVQKTSLGFRGSFYDDSDWQLSAELKNKDNLKPIFSAIGKYRHKISNNFDLEMGLGFKEYYSLNKTIKTDAFTEEFNSWRGSLYTRNSWQIWEPLQLNCELKLDHYEYVEQMNYISPQVEIVYEPASWAKMSGTIGLDTIHPDRAYEDFDEVPTIYEGTVEPERATKYELRFEGGLGGGYLITLNAHYANVENKRVTMMPEGESTPTRYLYNAGDSIVKGMSLNLQKDIGHWLKGSLSYSYNKAVVLDTENLSLVFDSLDQMEVLLGKEITHELSTKLAAEIDATKTKVEATYKVVIGTLGEEDYNMGFVDTKRLDVKLIQKLPFLAFTGTEWEIHLNVRNLFDSHGFNYFLNSEEMFGAPRKISGGVSIYF